jgi:hypothetical protein
MAKHRTHSIEFKRQVAQDFIAGTGLLAGQTFIMDKWKTGEGK